MMKQDHISASLADYAVIGDCRTAALISKQGSMDWLCLPDFDSPSVFAALLDPYGGRFSISLANVQASARRYLPETAVLETTLRSAQGSIRLTDCMPVIENTRGANELQPLREILRRVEVIEGNPKIEVRVEARPDYARHQGSFRFRGNLGWSFAYKHFLLNLISNFPLQPRAGILGGDLQAEAGDVYWFSLTLARASPAILMPVGEKSNARIDATAAWWRQWCGQCRYGGSYRDQIIRSLITLRLMTFTPSGALLAAVTTSLPEKPGGWMNWDYRYCWPRDSALALSAFMDLGLRQEADGFFDWLMLTASLTRPRLRAMYDVYGRYRIGERFLDYMTGYGNSRPVRIGNRLQHQIQHDVWGEVMFAVEDWIHRFGPPEAFERALIQNFGRSIAKLWREPDNGIWEIRDQRRHYTYSKAMAWYVFDASLRLGEQQHIRIPRDDYRSERDAVRREVESRGFNEKRNCYTGVFDGDTVDASLLRLPHYGYIDYDHPRMAGTWKAIRNDLEHKGLILRYPPGFANSQPGEGAFIVCNFWAVDYLSGSGQMDEAEDRLQRLIGLANDVGIYSESVDAESHEPLGNLPQSFSHAGLIHSIMMLDRLRASRAASAA